MQDPQPFADATGFTGEVRTLDRPRFGVKDAAVLGAAVLFAAGIAVA